MALDCGLNTNDSHTLRTKELHRRAQELLVVEQGVDEETPLRDVILSVRINADSEERKSIGSSSVMLSLVSGYFRAMFESDAIEKGETIELSDKVTMAGMKAINALGFGVFSMVQVTRDNLAALIAAAQYCQVPGLSELCDEFIRGCGIIRETTAMARLIVDLDQLGFAKEADEWMSKLSEHQMNELFLDQSTLRMSSDLFTSLLKCKSLSLKETTIWFQSVKWAQYQAEIYNGDGLTNLIKVKPLIRFPLMSERFILKEVMPTKLLSDSEFVQICSSKHRVVNDSELFCESKPRFKGKPRDGTRYELSYGADYQRDFRNRGSVGFRDSGGYGRLDGWGGELGFSWAPHERGYR